MDSSAFKHRHLHRNRHLRLCLQISITSVISLLLLLVILALTVFRPHHPISTVNSVKLTGLNAGFDVPTLTVNLNVTLDLDITAVNPNRASFRYGNGGSAELYYRNALVGEAVIPPGEISAGGSERIDVVLTVLAGRLIGDSAVYSDLISGSVELMTYATIPGRVSVMGIFKHHMVSYTICDVTVSIRNRTVENSDCRYKTKL